MKKQKNFLSKLALTAIKCVNIVLDSCHVLDINLKLEIFGFLIPCRIKNMFYLCDIYYPLEKSYFKESCVSQYHL